MKKGRFYENIYGMQILVKGSRKKKYILLQQMKAVYQFILTNMTFYFILKENF